LGLGKFIHYLYNKIFSTESQLGTDLKRFIHRICLKLTPS